MNIQEIEGRELDAAVATEVMGWRLLAGDTWVDDKNNIAHPNFRPSRHIAAAMQVVEKMRQDDFWWKAAYKETIVEGIYQAGYSVTFRCVRAGTCGYHTAAELKLPLAICRAARMAAEAE